jgi:hypothetical protein
MSPASGRAGHCGAGSALVPQIALLIGRRLKVGCAHVFHGITSPNVAHPDRLHDEGHSVSAARHSKVRLNLTSPLMIFNWSGRRCPAASCPLGFVRSPELERSYAKRNAQVLRAVFNFGRGAGCVPLTLLLSGAAFSKTGLPVGGERHPDGQGRPAALCVG